MSHSHNDSAYSIFSLISSEIITKKTQNGYMVFHAHFLTYF
ncbi:hypothetical protein CLOLEP_01974 [[Clostridium] leptum DSM 753]|uniref:Uncharacterized protein n=1 Tax=[Clostridium] leptum DSM 753 TaxID=428125 RepID=A7VTT0_9FIRM|nr:hypothetical protein CLOLEP_01974 [[Clostridium] leptum DSM 753]